MADNKTVAIAIGARFFIEHVMYGYICLIIWELRKSGSGGSIQLMKAKLVAISLILATVTAQAAFETVYMTKSGKTYHKETCGHLKKVRIAISRDDAVRLGYKACKTCKP